MFTEAEDGSSREETQIIVCFSRRTAMIGPMKTTLRFLVPIALVAWMATLVSGAPDAATLDAKKSELAKWDHPQEFMPKSGPGGTEWDAAYRSFIQTDANTTAKGLPTHAQAAAQIKADAAQSSAALQKHKGWILYIKHYSQTYRPEAATTALRQLYVDLVEVEFGGTTPKTKLPFEDDSRLVIHRNVTYGKTHPNEQRLDAYLVKSARPTPVLIEVHGGGWRRGQKSEFIYQGDLIGKILAAGISVISIDYRLTPPHQFPAQMEDAARAVQFVRSKAKEWNLDPLSIVAMGGSAGAHLSAWVALHDDLANPRSADPVERMSSRLCGFVELWGPMDLTRVKPSLLAKENLRGADFAAAYTAALGCSAEGFESDPAIRRRIREASPLFLVTPEDPPAFIMAGGPPETALDSPPPAPALINDPHSAWHGVLLAEAMKKAGIQITQRLGPAAGKDADADRAAILSFLNYVFFR